MNKLLKIVGFAALSVCASCSKEEPSNFRVGNALYRFPSDQVDFISDDGAVPPTYVHIDTPPKPENEDVEFLRYVSNKDDGRPTKLSVMLNYHGRFGSPLSNLSSKEAKVIYKPWGMVLCDTKAIEVGVLFACGIEVTEQGASWEVRFDHSRLADGVDMAAEAKRILAAYRVRPPQR